MAGVPQAPGGGEPLSTTATAGDEGGHLEEVVSLILRSGVLVSAAIIACGVLLWALSGRSGYPPGGYPVSLPAVLDGARHARPLAVVQVGLVVLVFTPVLRVVASLLMFLRQRDWAYVGFAATVLVLLAAGFLVGGA